MATLGSTLGSVQQQDPRLQMKSGAGSNLPTQTSAPSSQGSIFAGRAPLPTQQNPTNPGTHAALATAPKPPTALFGGAPGAGADPLNGLNPGSPGRPMINAPAGAQGGGAPAAGGLGSAAPGWVGGGPPSPQNVDTYSAGALISQQHDQGSTGIQRAQQLGANIQGQGAQVANQQAGQVAAYNQAGQGFDARAQTTAGSFGVGQRVPMGGGTQAPAALSTGQLGAAPSIGQIADVAGQLGSGPQASPASPNVAGRFGGGPQVGQVGNIQMQGGPGAVAGQLGNQGVQNADQLGMLSRLGGFLDSPEGPSVAEAQLRQAQAGNMADLIGAARSGRGGAGAQAQALRGALSEGSALMSDTAGQLATLRAQESDMQRNRQLSAIGLGGQMAEAQRGQDLNVRGQDLAALQGDQATALAGRGQDLQAAMANQGTQTALEQLRAQAALDTRGQNLAALQGDQANATQRSLAQLQADLGARGQDLSALQGDQSTALGREQLAAQSALTGRGQDLSLMQGNQATALGARGQDVTRELGLANVNMGLRGQDAGVLMGDADRNLAAQRLDLDAGLGYGNLANTASGQGLNFLSQANQQGIMAQGMSNDMLQGMMNNQTSLVNQDRAAQAGIEGALRQQQMANDAQPGFWEQLALNVAGGAATGGGSALATAALSDERAKTDISPLDRIADHLRCAPGYSYRYREGFGEDPDVEHAGPMAQDLERGPFGKALVKKGADGLRRVDTSRLSLVNHAALAGIRSELDELKKRLEG